MAGAGIENTIVFSQGEKLSASGATDISRMQETATDVSRVNHTGDPNGAVAANPSSLCHDPVSGNVYFKQTGTGNTGWVQIGTVLNDYHDSRYIVSAGGSTDGANYTTIASAITAAVSAGGVQNVAIQPATYTENFTLPANINLVNYGGGNAPPVIINGKITCSDAGTRMLAGIRLKTNSDFSLVISGSAATVVNLVNCDLNCSNNTGISMTSSGSPSLNIIDCTGDLATTGIAYISKSGNGTFRIYQGNFTNTGLSTTPNSITDGTFEMFNVSFAHIFDLGINTDGFNIYNSQLTAALLNTPVVTQASNGSAPQGTFFNCFLSSGTASCIALTSSSMRVINSTLTTSNTNAISETGASSLEFSGLKFGDTGTGINVTTQTKMVEGPSKTIGGTNSGQTNTLLVQNLSNTSNSQALISASVAGGTAGDSYFKSEISGGQAYSWGLDNSDSDAFVFSANGTLGTNNFLRANSSGNLTQLQFQASGTSGTASTQQLSYYEEGTWTPTLTGASTAGTTTYSVQAGYYTKIGNMVFVSALITISAATGTGNATIGNLPFTVKNQSNYTPRGVALVNSTTWTWPASTTTMVSSFTSNSTNAIVICAGSGIASSVLQMNNSALTLSITGSYQV